LKDDREVVVDETEFFLGAVRLALAPFALSSAETWRGDPPVGRPGVLRQDEPIRWREAVEIDWEKSVLFEEAERSEALSLAKLVRGGEAKRCRWLESRRGAERGIDGIRRCSRHSFPSRRMSTLAGVLAGIRCAFWLSSCRWVRVSSATNASMSLMSSSSVLEIAMRTSAEVERLSSLKISGVVWVTGVVGSESWGISRWRERLDLFGVAATGKWLD
jgi:hypothetical protein